MTLVQAAQNQKQINTGLAKLLKLKIGVKVMLTVNIYTQYRLTHGQTGNISYTEFAQDSICEEYVKFSDE